MNDEEFLQKLREAFSIEAEEHLQAMTSGLLELEKSPAEPRRREIVETIFREAHSLKGAARAVNRTDIESLCQALESVFAAWKREGANVLVETFDALNAALDLLAKLRAQPDVPASASGQNSVREMARQIAQLAAPAAQPPPAPDAPPKPAGTVSRAGEAERPHVMETVRVPLAKMDALLLQAEEMVAVKLTAGQRAAEFRELGATLGNWRKEWSKIRAARPSGATGKLGEFLEWNAHQIDALDKKLSALAKTAERDERAVGAMVDELLEDAKQLVMLPFAQVLDAFPKQVRDLAREEGKEVALAISGSEVEIDKRILEEMKAPLLHLVRNAIDHGLEKPDARRQRGKPPHGTLTISVAQLDGNRAEIIVADDGDGIDAAKVKASAVTNGIVTEAEAAALSDEAACALIFHSGVSTSAVLTEISGRGLGMAIVREKVGKLGGQIAIETKPGAGTSFRIVLPLTLATFNGILVRAGGQTFVIPTFSVERIARVRRAEIKTVENRETISHDGHAVALAWLADILELPRREPPAPPPFVEVLILGTAKQRVAFAVETVLHEQEVLVKKLGRPLVRVRNIAGATVLGTGTPVLILNVADLLKTAVRFSAGGAPRPALDAAAQTEKRTRRVLVADDSVTSRMLLKNILESAGYHVTTAIDGVEALTAVRAGNFDLVVSDVDMPRMDGFELTAKIRAEKKSAELPVVLVSALGSREHQERGIDAGANAYIVKSSFDQSDLLEVIGRLV